jgi:hypothetical protein
LNILAGFEGFRTEFQDFWKKLNRPFIAQSSLVQQLKGENVTFWKSQQ